MSRSLITILLSSALALASVSTSAWSAADTRNQAPLPPAGAAAIKQAQGFGEERPFLLGAIYLGAAVLVLILIDGDDDGSSSTGT